MENLRSEKERSEAQHSAIITREETRRDMESVFREKLAAQTETDSKNQRGIGHPAKSPYCGTLPDHLARSSEPAATKFDGYFVTAYPLVVAIHASPSAARQRTTSMMRM